MTKIFNKDYYNPSHLLHLGRDHFYCGIYLLNPGTPNLVKDGEKEVMVCLFDSGGYLIHLGIELILKAILLEEAEKFKNEHNLPKIASHINSLSLSNYLSELKEIDGYFFSRYGKDNTNEPVEIGGYSCEREH